MATFTEHYDLLKPDPDDYYDVADFNENMDAIDLQMDALDAELTGVGDKVDEVREKVREIRTLIGDPDAPIENSLFGHMRASYLPNKNSSKEKIPRLLVRPKNSPAKNIYIYLWRFMPKFDGTIRVFPGMHTLTDYATSSNDGALRVYAYNTAYDFVPPPAGSEIANSPTSEAPIATYNAKGGGYTTTSSFLVPVKKAIPIVLVAFCKECTYFEIENFQICYDVIVS